MLVTALIPGGQGFIGTKNQSGFFPSRNVLIVLICV